MAHDLTKLKTPKFEFSFVDEVSGRKMDMVLDMNDIVARFRMLSGACFRPCADDAQGRIGLAVVMECVSEGKEIPKSLPSYEEVMFAIMQAFKIPTGNGLELSLTVLGLFFQDYQKLVEAKKGLPESPASPAPIPA